MPESGVRKIFPDCTAIKLNINNKKKKEPSNLKILKLSVLSVLDERGKVKTENTEYIKITILKILLSKNFGKWMQNKTI